MKLELGLGYVILLKIGPFFMTISLQGPLETISIFELAEPICVLYLYHLHMCLPTSIHTCNRCWMLNNSQEAKAI